jgi:hypothetical protein
MKSAFLFTDFHAKVLRAKLLRGTDFQAKVSLRETFA